MELLLILGLAAGGASFTISTTSIFRAFRELVSMIHPKIEELVHCPWCLNHYVSLIFVLSIYIHDDINGSTALTYWLGCTTIGGLCHHVLLRAYKPVMKAEMRRKQEKTNPNTIDD